MDKKKTPMEMYLKYKSLSTEQQENMQIQMCKQLDEINRIVALEPLLAFNLKDEVEFLYEVTKQAEDLLIILKKHIK